MQMLACKTKWNKEYIPQKINKKRKRISPITINFTYLALRILLSIKKKQNLKSFN